MIPVIGSDGWLLMPLRPTKFSPAKLAKVRVRDGSIVGAFAIERHDMRLSRPVTRLHWAEGVGSWEEKA